jgi:hypothetical protein
MVGPGRARQAVREEEAVEATGRLDVGISRLWRWWEVSQLSHYQGWDVAKRRTTPKKVQRARRAYHSGFIFAAVYKRDEKAGEVVLSRNVAAGRKKVDNVDDGGRERRHRDDGGVGWEECRCKVSAVR